MFGESFSMTQDVLKRYGGEYVLRTNKNQASRKLTKLTHDKRHEKPSVVSYSTRFEWVEQTESLSGGRHFSGLMKAVSIFAGS